MLAVIPFFHVFAMTVAMNLAIANGMRIVIHPKFDIKMVLKDIDEKKPTLMRRQHAVRYHQQRARPREIRPHQHQVLHLGRRAAAGGCETEIRGADQMHPGRRLRPYRIVAGDLCNPLQGNNKTGSIGLPLPGFPVRSDRQGTTASP